MSGPRMGNMSQLNGNRRPNMSRINYHENRQSSYHDHRQSSSHDSRQYDNRSHEIRHHDRQYERQSDNRERQDNRYSESRQHASYQQQPQPLSNSQHDDLIKYIHESWSKVEQDRGSSSSNGIYYQDSENHHLKDFRPFDLDSFMHRRVHSSQQHQHHS